MLGAGAWGTALALHLVRGGHAVSLWSHDPAEIVRLQADGENRRYLPGCALPPGLVLSSDLAATVARHDVVLIVVPSHAFAQVLAALCPLLRPQQRLLWATKGLAGDSAGGVTLLSELFAARLPGRGAAVLSGPSFAVEVGQGLPTAVTIAAEDERLAGELALLFHHGHFRAYISNDPVGVQLGGATKNVLAIAAGISDGLGYGANARAALVTRGLAEMTRIGVARGGRAETFMGLAGMGDLVLTCTDDKSRNRRMGLALGAGTPREQAEQQIGQVVEGIGAALAVSHMSARLGVETPISRQVYRVLYEGLDARAAVEELFAREPKPEFY